MTKKAISTLPKMWIRVRATILQMAKNASRSSSRKL